MDAKDLERIANKVAGLAGRVRTAGKIEFIRDQGPLRRDIRAPGFKWSPEAFNDLAKILWASQRAHSYAMAALRIFSRLPSSQFSPDGLLGGRGYIQSVKDMRSSLSSAAQTLSAFNDTIHDEINAPHWNEAETPEANELVEDAERVKANPDAFVDSGYEEVQGPDTDIDEPLHNPTPDEMNPSFESDEEAPEDDDDEYDDAGGSSQTASAGDFWLKGELLSLANDGAQREAPDLSVSPERPGSKVPSDKTEPRSGKSEAEMAMNTTTVDRGSYAAAIRKIAPRSLRSDRVASSSVPGEALPTPRVDHIGPGASGVDAGHFNWDALWPSDDPSGEGLHSGVNVSDHLLDRSTADGVTGYDNPTDGDSSVLQLAHSGYSLLPGSRNEKIMPYYDRDLTEADVEWMKANSDPDPVIKPVVRKPELNLWDAELI